jgi:hypothetical protein
LKEALMRINLLGGPGIGKSTTAMWLASELKCHRVNVELVPEYAKTWVTEKRVMTPATQVYFLGKQSQYEERFLAHGVEHIITDSPLVIGAFHAHKYVSPQLGAILMDVVRFFDTLRSYHFIMLERGNYAYEQQGRYQTEAEARAMDAEILAFVRQYYPPEKISHIRADNRDELLSEALLLTAAVG